MNSTYLEERLLDCCEPVIVNYGIPFLYFSLSCKLYIFVIVIFLFFFVSFLFSYVYIDEADHLLVFWALCYG